MTDVEGVRIWLNRVLPQMIGEYCPPYSLFFCISSGPCGRFYVLASSVISVLAFFLKAFGKIRPIFRERVTDQRQVTVD